MPWRSSSGYAVSTTLEANPKSAEPAHRVLAIVVHTPTPNMKYMLDRSPVAFRTVGGLREDILVRLAVAPGDRGSKFEDVYMRFNALNAKCFMPEDRHQMLAAIEATFGTTTPFNKLIRGIFAAHVGAQSPAVSAA